MPPPTQSRHTHPAYTPLTTPPIHAVTSLTPSRPIAATWRLALAPSGHSTRTPYRIPPHVCRWPRPPTATAACTVPWPPREPWAPCWQRALSAWTATAWTTSWPAWGTRCSWGAATASRAGAVCSAAQRSALLTPTCHTPRALPPRHLSSRPRTPSHPPNNQFCAVRPPRAVQVGARVLAKAYPEERVGVFAQCNGALQVTPCAGQQPSAWICRGGGPAVPLPSRTCQAQGARERIPGCSPRLVAACHITVPMRAWPNNTRQTPHNNPAPTNPAHNAPPRRSWSTVSWTPPPRRRPTQLPGSCCTTGQTSACITSRCSG